LQKAPLFCHDQGAQSVNGINPSFIFYCGAVTLNGQYSRQQYAECEKEIDLYMSDFIV
jgi:hypothetical protein